MVTTFWHKKIGAQKSKNNFFINFTFTNLSRCSQSINSLIYVYSIQIPSYFLWVLVYSRDRTSSYYHCPKKFSALPPASHSRYVRDWDLLLEEILPYRCSFFLRHLLDDQKIIGIPSRGLHLCTFIH